MVRMLASGAYLSRISETNMEGFWWEITSYKRARFSSDMTRGRPDRGREMLEEQEEEDCVLARLTVLLTVLSGSRCFVAIF